MLDGYGFGYTRDEFGMLWRKPNKGGLEKGLDVEIGKYTNIDLGSYRNTKIGTNTKIDSMVHIGHNAWIGKSCLIVAGTVIGGSAEIGDFCYIGMGARILDHVKIGNHCLIAAGAVVTEDVPDRTAVKGIPARKFTPNLSPQELYSMIGLTQL